jgi:hypothetical protein
MTQEFSFNRYRGHSSRRRKGILSNSAKNKGQQKQLQLLMLWCKSKHSKPWQIRSAPGAEGPTETQFTRSKCARPVRRFPMRADVYHLGRSIKCARCFLGVPFERRELLGDFHWCRPPSSWAGRLTKTERLFDRSIGNSRFLQGGEYSDCPWW